MFNKPFVIGIAGAVASGKSWFAEKLRESFSEPVCVFTLDSYSKDGDFVNKLEFRYDNPQAIDFDRAYFDLLTLLEGGTVAFPIYDYKFHKVGYEREYTAPAVIIIEGLYSFYDKRFLEIMDVKIWIESDDDTRLKRRILRDIKERGETRDESMARHINDSEPAYQKFYKDGRVLADCIFLNVAKNEKLSLIKMLKCTFTVYLEKFETL